MIDLLLAVVLCPSTVISLSLVSAIFLHSRVQGQRLLP